MARGALVTIVSLAALICSACAASPASPTDTTTADSFALRGIVTGYEGAVLAVTNYKANFRWVTVHCP